MQTFKMIQVAGVALLLIFFSPQDVQSQLFTSPGNGLFSDNQSLNYDLRLGSSFTTGFGSGSFHTHSIAPSVNWAASERFTVLAGTLFTYSAFPGLQQNTMIGGFDNTYEQSFLSDNIYSNLTYTLGFYRVSENLTFMGGAYFESSNLGQNAEMNPEAFNFNAKGMIMGFDYKISDKMRIGAEFNFRSGHSPYYYHFSPYSSPGFYQSSPFDNSRRAGWLND